MLGSEGNDVLEDKAVFITGVARGLGLGIARACAARGARLALTDIDGDALAIAAEELAGVTDVVALTLDVRDRQAVAAAADQAEQALGPVSALFNNAGVADSVSPRATTGEVWDWMVDVNLNGVYNGVQAFAPRMIRRGEGGWIVNTSSLAGLAPLGSGFAYQATKYAVVGMSESLREELAHHQISVSVVCPGNVATSIMENTARLRPDDAEPHSAKVSEILSSAHEHLLAAGVSIDDAGESVVRGMLAGQPFIFTDGLWGAHLESYFADVRSWIPSETAGNGNGMLRIP